MHGYFIEMGDKGGKSCYLSNVSCPPLGDFVYMLNTFASPETKTEGI